MRALAIICGLACGTVLADFSPPQRLVVVTDINFPPYLFQADDGALQGILKDKWELWSSRNGIPVRVQGMEWHKAQEAVQDGSADIIEALAYTEARTRLYEYSPPYAPIEARVYFHRTISGIHDVASLRGFAVGAKEGSACGNWLRERGVAGVRDYPTSEALVKAAVATEVRLFCMDAPAADYYLYKLGLADQFRQTEPLYTTQFHWALKKGRAELRDFVQKGFENIRPDELREIDERWLGNPLRLPIASRYLVYVAVAAAAVLGATVLLVFWNRTLHARVAARTAQLRDQEMRFRQTFELAGSGMAHVGLDGRFLRANRKLCEMLGYRENELIGRPVADHSHPDDTGMTTALRARVRSKEITSASFEKRYLRKDGTVIWASLTIALVCDAAGNPEYEIAVIEDVTKRMEAEERIRRLNRVYAVLSGINAAIVRIRDRGEMLRETCRIAVADGEFLVARVIDIDEGGTARIAATTEADPLAFQAVLDEYNRDPAGAPSLFAQALRSGKPLVSNDLATDPRVRNRAELTQEGTYALALLPILVEQRIASVLILRAREAGMFDDEEMKLLTELAGDVAFALEHIEKEKKLDYLALYDSLTGLANRTLFLERLNQSIHAAAQSGGKFAIVLTDLERLRTVNESLGRHAGDALLRQVGERIGRSAGRTEAGRIAADQFAVVLATVKGRSEAGRRVQAMRRDCFSAPFLVDDAELRVSAKAGIALYPNDGDDAETLLKNAEAALRNGKQTGESLVFYTQALTERTAETLTLVNELRRALERAEFVLHYQPKLDLSTRRIVGVEALIRWQNPELGLVPPMKFIPLMEETGMILEAGAWALSRAVMDHQRWLAMELPAPRIAVNVSPVQLRKKDFVSTIEQAIRDGANPPGIDLEITESLVMEDIEGNIGKLKAVQALGLGVAIDDFGTGYSSLAYLAKLPVQTLKIDRSFVITMLAEPDTMTLVQTIISLAHSLRLRVVAEGVDSEDQAGMLWQLGCDEMQGYLFSKPLPFDQMTALLEQG